MRCKLFSFRFHNRRLNRPSCAKNRLRKTWGRKWFPTPGWVGDPLNPKDQRARDRRFKKRCKIPLRLTHARNRLYWRAHPEAYKLMLEKYA